MNTPRLANVIESFYPLGPGLGHSYKKEIKNTLNPHKVEIVKSIIADPNPASVEVAGGFWGRVNETNHCLDSQSPIPEAEWRFHITNLQKIAMQTQQETLASSVSSATVGAERRPVNNTTHKIKKKSQVLDAEIEKAKKLALNASDPNSVWAELVKLAESKEKIGCLLSTDGNSIKYQVGEEVKFFRKRSLNERMNRTTTY